MFIRMYYAISPTIVKLFDNKKSFHRFNKTILDKLVLRLNSKGYKNTKYVDKY